MNIFGYPLFFWFILSLVFLAITFFVESKYRIYVLVANILMIFFIYVGIANIIGLPKPLDYSIPLYTMSNSKFIIETGWYDDNRIYLVIRGDIPKLVTFPRTDEFLDRFKKAVERNGGQSTGLMLSDNYAGDLAAHTWGVEPPPVYEPPKDEREENVQERPTTD